jgi:hypothetical protein
MDTAKMGILLDLFQQWHPVVVLAPNEVLAAERVMMMTMTTIADGAPPVLEYLNVILVNLPFFCFSRRRHPGSHKYHHQSVAEGSDRDDKAIHQLSHQINNSNKPLQRKRIRQHLLHQYGLPLHVHLRPLMPGVVYAVDNEKAMTTPSLPVEHGVAEEKINKEVITLLAQDASTCTTTPHSTSFSCLKEKVEKRTLPQAQHSVATPPKLTTLLPGTPPTQQGDIARATTPPKSPSLTDIIAMGYHHHTTDVSVVDGSL